MTQCTIEGCEKPVHGRGFCKAHHIRWSRHGDPLGGGTARGSTQDFISYALRYTGADCLIWPYSRNEHGYGTVSVAGRTARSHRVVCIEAHGTPPTPKHQAAHSCGVRLCCNPSHLRWATRSENESDKYTHGTDQRGGKNHHAKLCEQAVLHIKSHKGLISQSELAKTHGVSRQAISDVHRERSWPWLKAAMEAGR